MSFFLFWSWIAIHTLILNIAIKAGWSHDAGYVAPFLMILSLHLIIALFNAKNRSGS
jgi:hypothetical protein